MTLSLRRNISLILLANIIVKPVHLLFIDLELIHRMGEQDYGTYFLILSYTSILSILLDIGIANLNNTKSSQNTHFMKKNFLQLIYLKCLLFIVYLFACFILSIYLGIGKYWKYILLICINQYLISAILFLRSYIGALQLFKKDSFISVIDKILLFIVLGCLIYIFNTKISIYGLICCNMFAYICTVIYIIYTLRSYIKVSIESIDITKIRLLIFKSLPYALLILLMSAYQKSDSLMIHHLRADGLKEVGNYAKSYRIFEAISNFPYLFSIVLLPTLAREIFNKNNISPVINDSIRLLITPALYIVILCYFYSEYFIALKFNVTEGISETLFWLSCSFLAVCINYIFGTVLTAGEKLKYLNITSATGLIINILLNYIYIPKYGIVGASFSSFITQFCVSICQIVISKKCFNISIDWHIIKRILVFGAVCLFLGYILKYILQSTDMELYTFIIVSACIFPLFKIGVFRKSAH